jgi:hypothetical protein
MVSLPRRRLHRHGLADAEAEPGALGEGQILPQVFQLLGAHARQIRQPLALKTSPEGVKIIHSRLLPEKGDGLGA